MGPVEPTVTPQGCRLSSLSPCSLGVTGRYCLSVKHLQHICAHQGQPERGAELGVEAGGPFQNPGSWAPLTSRLPNLRRKGSQQGLPCTSCHTSVPTLTPASLSPPISPPASSLEKQHSLPMTPNSRDLPLFPSLLCAASHRHRLLAGLHSGLVTSHPSPLLPACPSTPQLRSRSGPLTGIWLETPPFWSPSPTLCLETELQDVVQLQPTKCHKAVPPVRLREGGEAGEGGLAASLG